MSTASINKTVYQISTGARGPAGAAGSDAEVTFANVAAAGAMMAEDLANPGAVGNFDPADYATAAQGTDARTPTAHKSTHATGGDDELLPSDIGAMEDTNAAVNAAIATNPAATRKTIHTRRGLNNIPYPNYIGHRGAAGLYPQSSQMAFDAAVAFGMPIMEPDVFALADGTLLVAHGRDELLLDGVIPPNMTEILTFDEAEARARLRISPIGYATWSGSPIYGFEGMDIPILTFEDMLKLYGNKVILLPDMKSSGRPIAVHVIEQLEAYGIEKDMVLIGGGILAEAQVAGAAGWTTGLWSIQPAHYAARLADGIEWNGLNWADTAGITGSKAAGMRVAVSSVQLHWERDAAIADGAELLWTPQVLYVPQHDRHRLVYDPYPLGKTYHGHTTTNRTKARVIDGKIDFIDAAAAVNEEVLLGWAGPTKSPFDFVFDFTLNYTTLFNATRFVSIWLSDTDRVWKGGSAPTWFGFDILARANGDLQIYQYNGGVDDGLKASNTGNDALTLGVDYDFRLTVTQTSIKLENLTNALETVWDTTLPYKKYLSLRCSGADAKVSKMIMKDNSKSDLLTPENLGVATSDQGTTADSALQATVATKTTPIDADTVDLQDSADTGARKLLTFANLWTWVLGKIQGTALAFTSTTRPTSAGTGTPAATSLITRDDMDMDAVDFGKASFRDDFQGGIDGATVLGELGWQRVNVNGAGTFRPQNVSPGFGIAGIHTAAASRAAQILQWDVSNAVGGGGFSVSLLENSTTVVRFRIYLHSLNQRVDAGFMPFNTIHPNRVARKLSLNYTPLPSSWEASAEISADAYIRPTTANGRRYYASTAGTTDTTEPTWPTGNLATVNDGTVVWTEAGTVGGANFTLFHHSVAGETAGAVVDTGLAVAASTWYEVEMKHISGSLWRFTINGTTAEITTGLTTNTYLPFFAVESTDGLAQQLSIDYWGMTSRLTRP